MKNRYLLSLGMTTIFLLSGCGNGSSDNNTTEDAETTPTPTPTPTTTPVTIKTVTGQFVDTFVSNLNYTCSSGTTGKTNTKGEYTCSVGNTVDFFLGKYKLGSATASSGLVTPEVLYPNNPAAELNVAQILQTLDSISTDEIITIPANYSALDNVTATPESSNFDAVVTSVIGVTLVTEEAAQAHLNGVEILVRLSGKTFYYVGGENDALKVHTIVFNKDLSSFNSTEDDGPSTTSLRGDHLYLPNNETFTLKEATADYLVLNFFQNAIFDSTFKLYYNKSKADADYESQKNILTSLIVGKTRYFKNSKGAIGSRTYGTDGTYTGTFKGSPVSGTYTIKANVLSVVRTSATPNVNIKLTYLKTISNVLQFDISVNGGATFQTSSYATETARDAS